ncbi:jg15591 [Pararge aegeria aegeria]|uniref:Jg15591 protein n=1 Tax=Pararge aegeria aegeria TaxID=348720 RepID=A0A8S4RSU7_9NEOP|nr:jg15591 [Pararge aegeria aegeria]
MRESRFECAEDDDDDVSTHASVLFTRGLAEILISEREVSAQTANAFSTGGVIEVIDNCEHLSSGRAFSGMARPGQYYRRASFYL